MLRFLMHLVGRKGFRSLCLAIADRLAFSLYDELRDDYSIKERQLKMIIFDELYLEQSEYQPLTIIGNCLLDNPRD